jgi:hypothetical protein
VLHQYDTDTIIPIVPRNTASVTNLGSNSKTKRERMNKIDANPFHDIKNRFNTHRKHIHAFS